VSIKNKFATAVATAGLLAGLFGSAFVPVARAAVSADAITISGCDSGTVTETANAAGTIRSTDCQFAVNTYVTLTVGSELTDDVSYTISGGTFKVDGLAGTGTMIAVATTKTTSNVVVPGAATINATTLTFSASAAGTVTVTATESSVSGGVTTTDDAVSYTMTAISAAVSGVPSASKSKLWESYVVPAAEATTAGTPLPATASATDAPQAATGGAAYLTFVPKDAYDVATAGTTDVTATASGPCVVAKVAADSTVGTAAKTVDFAALDRSADGDSDTTVKTLVIVKVTSDGTGGGTCSVAFTAAKDAGTKTLIATGSVAFYGTGTTITFAVDQEACIISAACADALSYTVVDANGNRAAVDLAPGTDLTVTADDGSAGATFADGTATATTSAAKGQITPTCTADQEKLTITVNKTGYTSNSVSFYCSKATASSVTASWGSTSVEAGSLQTLTISAKDDLGYPVAKKTSDIEFTVTVNATVYTAPPADFDGDLDGVVTAKYIMPSAIGGTVQARILLAGSATSGTKTDIADAIEATEVVATATVVGPTSSATLSVGPKKLVATANFGAVAANKKVTFVIENAAGRVRTYYRRANASGVATFTIKLRGTWDVYASYGDDITELGKLVRK
jgi:hypothetical protein